jgi:hypothetical protein
MLKAEGMGFAPWGVLAQGKLQSPSQIAQRKSSSEPIRGGGELGEDEIKLSEALGKIGEELGVSVTAVALAWSFKKMPYVFPIGKSSLALPPRLDIGCLKANDNVHPTTSQSVDARSSIFTTTSTPSVSTSPTITSRRSNPSSRSTLASLRNNSERILL